MGILLQQKWRHATIEHKVAAVQRKLLDGLPTLYAAALLGRILVLLARDVGVLMRQHGAIIRYIVILFVALIVTLMLRARLVRLVVVGIVMRFWVYGVVASRGGAVACQIVD